MKIVILHHHAVCPFCNQLSCIYADFFTDADGTKMQYGFECGRCHEHTADEEFDKLKLVEIECPEEKLT